ncbi:hypothetical protein MES4922_10230 [Mesorhizobium ventifaucium]|uniref:Uncharacterized protein n=1 Tax=Mesorhizobium ventifaucium TaxID=666020 RepID=A0ABM9DEV3_9HYPH|nr:hypothetical protein MES4922_10230 [Mesorhizobium ventifaucium]
MFGSKHSLELRLNRGTQTKKSLLVMSQSTWHES